MAQRRKIEVENLILETARKEFRLVGFHNSSMRTIADKAFISKSNIYTYYSSKSELFQAVVKVTVDAIDNVFNMIENPDTQPEEEQTLDAHIAWIELLADFIEIHRSNLYLLFFKTAGSSLDNFVDTIIDRYTEGASQSYQYWADKVNFTNRSVSTFFIHNLASSYIGFIREILMHDIPKKKIIEYGREFMLYTYRGCEALYGY